MMPPPTPRSLLVTALLAAAAALARHADGSYWPPTWLAVALQVPVLIVWITRRSDKATTRRGNTAEGGCATRRDRLITIILLLAAAALAVHRRSLDAFFIATMSFIAGQLLLDLCGDLYRRFDAAIDRPRDIFRTFIRLWLLAIPVLTILLAIPLATKSSVPDYRHNFWLHISECAFTAVSALCLVGTSSYSFAEDFSLFGQSVLLLTTQLAAMGFAAIGLAAVRPLLSRGVSLRSVYRAWVILQLVGAVLTLFAWRDADAPSLTAKIAYSLTYCTAALANSGFTLRPNGLADELANPLIFTLITSFAIIGSIGLPIILDLLVASRRPIKPYPSQLVPGPWHKTPNWDAGVTFLLLFFIAGLLFLFETPRLLPDNLVPSRPFDLGNSLVPMRDELQHAPRWRLAVFVSATLRTAGLQSIPLAPGAVSWPSFVLLLVGMTLGGSSGGVAGGFRSTALALFAIAVLHGRAAWSVHPNGVLIRRKILRWAPLLVLAYLGVCGLGVAAAALFTDASPHEWIFEPIAAAGGVGLSTGLTAHLTWPARLAIIAVMVLGKLIPVVFWLRAAEMLRTTLQPKASARPLRP